MAGVGREAVSGGQRLVRADAEHLEAGRVPAAVPGTCGSARPRHPAGPLPARAGGRRRRQAVDAVYVGGGGEQATGGQEHRPQGLHARGAARDERVAGVGARLGEDAGRQCAGKRDVCDEGDEGRLQAVVRGAGAEAEDPGKRALVAQEGEHWAGESRAAAAAARRGVFRWGGEGGRAVAICCLFGAGGE